VAETGVDAVIVQDSARTPDPGGLPRPWIHASTQMSITSGEGVRLAEELGCTR